MIFSTKQEGLFAIIVVIVMVSVWPSSATLAILIGIAALLFFASHEFSKGRHHGEPMNPLDAANDARQQEKARNRQALMEYLDSHERITNDDVERILNVSHATATRYMDEMQEEGLVHEVGEGAATHYKKK